MMINRRWVERNLGFDPVARPAPASTFAFTAAATSSNVDAVRAGVDYIVVGRPILEAKDPGVAAHEIVAEMERGER